MFCFSTNYFKRHEQFYEIVTYKTFATLNWSRKYKILLFFIVADWGTKGCVTTQTRGYAF